jgi:hypothetical protein
LEKSGLVFVDVALAWGLRLRPLPIVYSHEKDREKCDCENGREACDGEVQNENGRNHFDQSLPRSFEIRFPY